MRAKVLDCILAGVWFCWRKIVSGVVSRSSSAIRRSVYQRIDIAKIGSRASAQVRKFSRTSLRGLFERNGIVQCAAQSVSKEWKGKGSLLGQKQEFCQEKDVNHISHILSPQKPRRTMVTMFHSVSRPASSGDGQELKGMSIRAVKRLSFQRRP